MTLSVLSICQEALEGIGVDPPNSVTSGGDLGNRLRGIANAVGQNLATRYDWQELKAEGTFVTNDSSEIQYTKPASVRKIQDETLWNRTTQRRLFNLTTQGWNRIKSDGISPATEVYYWRGNQLLMPLDTVAAGQTIAFEYIDGRWVSNAGGTTFTRRFAGDTEIPRLDDHMFVLGVRWRYLQSLGLEYGEHFREFEDYVHQKQAENEPRETMSLNPYHRSEGYDTQIPDGNWNQ
jgi:hypothetical protein